MLLIISYLISLGIGSLKSAPYFFVLNFFYFFKIKKFYLEKNLLIIAFAGLSLSLFYIQNINQFFTSLAVIIISFILCNFFQQVNKKNINYFFRFFALALVLLYLISYIFFGSRNFAVQLIGIGTYNAHFFFLFITFALNLIVSKNANKYDILILSIVGLVLGGRTNIIISILLPFLYFFRNKTLLILFFSTSIFFLNNYFFSDFETILSSYFSDYDEKGFRLGPRELLYNCIYNKLSFYDYITGFSIEDKLSSCFITTIGARTESSFIQLLGNWGVFGFFWFLYISKFWLHKNYLWLYVLILFRASSGDFFFFSVFDWILLVPVFDYTHSNKKNFFIYNIKGR
ncbi:MAG: hypothetical protein CMG01_00070 [Candidatus Marinimicrobia bacterium]|nr:hypothetical protein [Candidatus Neomarinimicrobiota bacterium]|tara:strand:+ start:11732 stop:12763 length:1032 start_codon:yes stop_codon:yes gene_type:complete